jgi:hypothetical protein
MKYTYKFEIYIYIYINLINSFLRGWLMRLLEVVCVKFAGQASRLQIPTGDDVFLHPKSAWRQNSFLFEGPQIFLLRPSTNWMRPPHVMEGNLLHSKSTDQCVKCMHGTCEPFSLVNSANFIFKFNGSMILKITEI